MLMKWFSANNSATMLFNIISFVVIGYVSTQQHVAGVNGQWSDWSECSVTEGTGVKFRQRMCENPQNCFGRAFETASCCMLKCWDETNEVKNSWGDWSSCSATAHFGVKVRKRICDDAQTCFGRTYETKPCCDTECSENTTELLVTSPSTTNTRDSGYDRTLNGAESENTTELLVASPSTINTRDSGYDRTLNGAESENTTELLVASPSTTNTRDSGYDRTLNVAESEDATDILVTTSEKVTTAYRAKVDENIKQYGNGTDTVLMSNSTENGSLQDGGTVFQSTAGALVPGTSISTNLTSTDTIETVNGTEEQGLNPMLSTNPATYGDQKKEDTDGYTLEIVLPIVIFVCVMVFIYVLYRKYCGKHDYYTKEPEVDVELLKKMEDTLEDHPMKDYYGVPSVSAGKNVNDIGKCNDRESRPYSLVGNINGGKSDKGMTDHNSKKARETNPYELARLPLVSEAVDEDLYAEVGEADDQPKGPVNNTEDDTYDHAIFNDRNVDKSEDKGTSCLNASLKLSNPSSPDVMIIDDDEAYCDVGGTNYQDKSAIGGEDDGTYDRTGTVADTERKECGHYGVNADADLFVITEPEYEEVDDLMGYCKHRDDYDQVCRTTFASHGQKTDRRQDYDDVHMKNETDEIYDRTETFQRIRDIQSHDTDNKDDSLTANVKGAQNQESEGDVPMSLDADGPEYVNVKSSETDGGPRETREENMTEKQNKSVLSIPEIRKGSIFNNDNNASEKEHETGDIYDRTETYQRMQSIQSNETNPYGNGLTAGDMNSFKMDADKGTQDPMSVSDHHSDYVNVNDNDEGPRCEVKDDIKDEKQINVAMDLSDNQGDYVNRNAGGTDGLGEINVGLETRRNSENEKERQSKTSSSESEKEPLMPKVNSICIEDEDLYTLID